MEGFNNEDGYSSNHSYEDMNVVDHTYHDYSYAINNDPLHRAEVVPRDLNDIASNESFPFKLHDLLTVAESKKDPSLSNIISWQPHGRAFLVHDKDLFVDQILPL